MRQKSDFWEQKLSEGRTNTMKQCTQCHSPLEDGATRCPHCGAILEMRPLTHLDVTENGRWPTISSKNRFRKEEENKKEEPAVEKTEVKEREVPERAPSMQRLSAQLPLIRILIGAVLAVLLLFVVVHVSKHRMGKTSSTEEVAQGSAVEEASTEEASATEGALFEEADEDIAQVMEAYFNAFENRDVEAARTLLDELTPSNEPAILDLSYDHFKVEKVYVQEGLKKNARLVLVTYTYQCAGVDTPIPAYTCLYVVQNEEGQWKIMSEAASDEGVQAYMETLRDEPEIREVVAEVRAGYEKTLSEHPELVQKIGDSSFSAALVTAQVGERLRALTNVNVRASADTHGELLGALDEGTIVTKEGREGEWIIIRFEGKEAYVYGEFFEMVD